MKKYVIISLKHSSVDEIVFWKANCAGYTINPFNAGLYSETDVKQELSYVNDGANTTEAIAIPTDEIETLKKIGFKVNCDWEALKKYSKQNPI